MRPSLASGGEPLSAECSQAVSDTAKLLIDLGHMVEAADPGIDTMAVGLANRAIIAANTANMVRNRARALGREPSGQDVEAATWAMVQLGNAVTGLDYADAVLQIHLLSRKLGAFFQDYDRSYVPPCTTRRCHWAPLIPRIQTASKPSVN